MNNSHVCENCKLCGRDMEGAAFDNEVSEREYESSGACQDCQDAVFGSNGDDYEFEQIEYAAEQAAERAAGIA